jgi:hypothetical protein
MFGNITLLCMALMLCQLGRANGDVRGPAYVFAVFAFCIWVGDLFGKPGRGAMAPLIIVACLVGLMLLSYLMMTLIG